MSSLIDLKAIYQCSSDVVARYIGGELILIPIASGIGEAEDEIYTFNDTGRAIWEKLDGNRTLMQIIDELSREYGTAPTLVEADVSGLATELIKRKMLVTK